MRYEKKKNTVKGRKQKAQTTVLKSWEILQGKVGIMGKLANNEILEIEHARLKDSFQSILGRMIYLLPIFFESHCVEFQQRQEPGFALWPCLEGGFAEESY